MATAKVIFTIGTKTLETLPKDRTTDDLYAEQIKIICSKELEERALERIRALHPELTEYPVLVHAQVLNRSSVIEVTAVGAEAKYVRVYLDCLLDEAVAFLEQLRDNQGVPAIHKMVDEARSAEVSYKTARSRCLNAQDSGASSEEIVGLKATKDQAKAVFEAAMKSLEMHDFTPLHVGVLDSFAVFERPRPSHMLR